MDKKTQIPAPLERGDTIGIVAPAGNVSDRITFEAGIRILHEMGFKTKFPRNLWPGFEYLADSDDKRGAELQAMFNDPDIHAIMAARGGFGCLRMMDQLDFPNIAASKKFLIGFSDITLLHHALHTNCNLVTLHGPVVTSLSKLEKDCLEQFTKTVSADLRNWRFSSKVEILREGSEVRGITTGGNLATIISSIGTRYQQQWKNKIVFLEDTAEPFYRVDRMLTQLKMAGMLEEVCAIILGDFCNGLELDRVASIRHNESIWRRILELTPEKTSIWTNFPIGHGQLNYSIPLGLEVTLNNSSRSLNV